MAAIVRYSDQLPPTNDYPHRIISPVRPSACCATAMLQIGDLEVDGSGLTYYYKRCQHCGFTVRHFLPRPADELPETIPGVDGVLKLVGMASHSYLE